jgi:hypothetical protein
VNESPLFVRTHDLVLWLIPHVQKFPRAHRFGLGERVQRLLLDFQDALVAAGKSKAEKRREYLATADIQLEQLRGWIRVSLELNLLTVPQYEHVSRLVSEVGRLLGAWIKQG